MCNELAELGLHEAGGRCLFFSACVRAPQSQSPSASLPEGVGEIGIALAAPDGALDEIDASIDVP